MRTFSEQVISSLALEAGIMTHDGKTSGALSSTAGPGERRVYDDGYLRVEHDNYYVVCGGHRLNLTRVEFLLISRLTHEPERVVPSEKLWEHVWGGSKPLNVQSLHVCMHRLRRRFAPFGLRVENMMNVGYCLIFGRQK